MKKKILVISGDPNSINSEIICKCLKKLNNSQKKNIFLITNYSLFKKQVKQLKYPFDFVQVKNLYEKISSQKLKVLNVDLKFDNPFKVSSKSSSIFIRKCLELAHRIASKEEIKGIINCPIDKKLLKKKNQGVTEFLASNSGLKDGSAVMLIKNKYFSVSPITHHVDLKTVTKKINSDLITKKITIINKWFKKTLKKKPKIGVLGLNPHNAELKNNSEEVKIIIPSIKRLKKKNISIMGPLVSDTVFIKDYKKYDILVGMYHDQVLTPFKTIFKFDAINITLGLKYLRLSPDHGVATNIIKKKIANPISLLRCFEFLYKLK